MADRSGRPARRRSKLSETSDGSDCSTSDEGEPSELPMCTTHEKVHLEVTDSQHRYAKHLRMYHREWERRGSVGSFWDWIDAEPVVTMPDCPRERLQECRVTYLTLPEERAPYIVEVHQGRFYHPENSGTGEERRPYSTGEGEWIFVFSAARVLFCHRKTRGAFHHTSFLAGGPCIAAGTLVIQDGVLEELYPHSGHYRPGEHHLRQLLVHLRSCGVSLASVSVDVQRVYKVARADGNGTKKHTTVMAPATATLAFLETKLRASQCGLLDAIRNHVGGGAHRHGPGGEVSSVNSVAVGQQAARGPVGVGRRQPRGEHAAAPELAAPSWPSSLSYREQPRAPALAALAAMASCGEGEPGGPRAPEGAELHGAPAEAVSSDGGVEHTGAGALEVDSSA